MSLLDTFLRSSLLLNIVQSNVYVAIRSDASSSAATPIGSGTADDPWGGTSDNPAWFDYMMTHNVHDNQTVFLGPGTFPTTGNSADGGYVGWSARNGMRLVGSGIGSTTLKLADNPQNGIRYAVGINFGTTSLNGFELSDLTIDANLSGADTGTGAFAGAVAVRGSSIFIRRVKVIDYGTKADSVFNVLTLAGDDSENCVAEECVFEPPSTAHHTGSSSLRLFAFATIAGTHRFCAIRNCAARGNTTFEPPPSIATHNVVGIWPGAGVGTILEGNQLANLRNGIYSLSNASRDVVIQNNYIRNASIGIMFDQSSGSAAGRIIAFDNVVELSREVANPIAFGFRGLVDDQFADVIIRKNIVRQVMDSTRPLRTDVSGLLFERCIHVIAENNILNDTGTSLIGYSIAATFANCDFTKFFNNQTGSGVLMRAYDIANSKYVLELEDEVQDVLLTV